MDPTVVLQGLRELCREYDSRLACLPMTSRVILIASLLVSVTHALYELEREEARLLVSRVLGEFYTEYSV